MTRLTFFSILCIFLFGACTEIEPTIPCLSCDDEDIVIEEFDRKVFIEEFTGVRCVNCPQGSAEIENLIAVHGEGLIAVSIHSGFFSNPYSENAYDFRTPKGDDILNFLGEPLGYPTAIINRTKFGGEETLFTSQASWSGYIAEQLAVAPSVSVKIAKNYDSTNRKLDITVSGTAVQDINEPLKVTVLITENNITDTQLLPSGVSNDYVHKHVLRAVLSNATGDPLVDDLATGASYEKTYTFTIPEGDETGPWNTTNINIIAYVHYGSGTTKEVLQAEETHLID